MILENEQEIQKYLNSQEIDHNANVTIYKLTQSDYFIRLFH